MFQAKLGLTDSMPYRAVNVVEVNPEFDNRGIKPALDWVCKRLVASSKGYAVQENE